MNAYSLRPGDVIGTDVRIGPYLVHHVGVVSCIDAWRGVFVISSSKKVGKVTEEHLDDFAGGGAWAHHPELRGPLSSQEVVRRARERLGDAWSLFADNCEHFVREVQGLVRASPQVVGGVAKTVAIGGLLLLATAALAALLDDD